MSTLVTGGAGFIGSHSVRALLARGERVSVLDDLSTGLRSRLDEGQERLRFIQGSLLDDGALAEALVGVTRVLHLAALPSVPRSLRDPLRTHEVNATGTLRLLEACRRAGVSRVVVASSSSVYGDRTEPGPKQEEQAPRPASPYAASKLAAEAAVLAWGRCFGIETLALRYFNVFGPGQSPTSDYAAVIPKFGLAALEGRELTIYGSGKQVRDFTFVDNVVDANLRALASTRGVGEAINVACGRGLSLLELVDELGLLLGKPPVVVHEAARPGDVGHSVADIAKARELLGYAPSIDFQDGLSRTLASLRPLGELASPARATRTGVTAGAGRGARE